ncbi:MAG: hypothetical protein HXX13_18280 [Bacteroidetes bacterium]|nr:hypothetical protein [Bacteroidota bacterium]
MKRLLLISFLSAGLICNAATGNAKDGELMVFMIIFILSSPLLLWYTIHTIKLMKKRRIEHQEGTQFPE